MTFKIIFPILTLLTFDLMRSTIAESTVLTGPTVTKFGEWTSWAECEPDHFVVAADLRHSTIFNMLDQKDDLGVISVVLECQNFLDKATPPNYIFTEMSGVTSSVVVGGIRNNTARAAEVAVDAQNSTANFPSATIDVEYELPLRTRCDGLAVGFSINSAKEEMAKDNTAANNLRLYCSNMRQNAPSFVEAYGLYEGEWSEEQLCGAEYAICGIQAQADDLLKASVDHMGLNNLRLKCCRVPNPAENCEPTDTWELVAECDNIESSSNTPLTCAYTQNVGIGASSTKLRDHYDDYLLNEGLGFTLEQGELAGNPSTPFWLASGLSQNFRENLAQGPETFHNWGVASERTWNSERAIDGKIEIDMGLKGFVYQVVGRCSYFTARTNSFRRVDSNSPTRQENVTRTL